ncbi:MAG: penicillin-binding protein 2 [Pseudomonadales bacterium]|nr:penicillin-binding protein 2 [Pseudomonadales bacterium]
MNNANRFNKWSWRVYPLWLLLAIALVAIVIRLGQLQVVDSERGRQFLQQQGDARVLRTEKIAASRGEIVDRNGELLAFSTPVKSVWANPSLIDNSDAAIQRLASSLAMSESALRKRLLSNAQFVYLKRQLDPQKAERIRAQKFEGIFFETEYKRFYPAGEVAAHLVGFTGVDHHGQEGIELSYDSLLTAEAGAKQVMKNAHHEVIKDIKLVKAATEGQRLALSIDMRLQYIAYRELKAAVASHKAKSGSLVILDAQSGEVLALVNQPSYNANDRRQLVPENMRNRALIDLFEPGSTVKPFTVMAALESGDFDHSTIIDTSTGFLKLGGNTVLDSKDYGKIDLATVLSKSSNVGTSKIALDLDINEMQSLFARAGLGEYCATGFPGEQAGYLPNHQDWADIQKATLSFGHGLSVNAVQLARAYAVIANDGIKQPVSLLKLSDEERLARTDIRSAERVISASVTREVREMMKAVVEKGGTGMQARIAGYSVAGKTGTAHKVGASGYEASRYRSTFAGMVPATAPKLVAVVTINDPSGEKYYGGEIAAPVFSRVMQSALRLMNITPDRLHEFGDQSREHAEVTVAPANAEMISVREQHGSV